MSERLDKAIQEIAVKHGVVLSKDDPILILQTMNDRLIEESRQAQAAMLARFREEMEAISSQWRDDAKEKAEKVLNAALAASTETMTRVSKEFTSDYNQTTKKLMDDLRIEMRVLSQQIYKFSWLGLSAIAMMILSVTMIRFFF
ncbi:TPA: conjugal transfer protein TraM [Legionella pneumophila]|nr:conjugal transfer protein TraM [Legionella pneumophila]HAT7746816.1 conjugal transfer protein TraM [Legionella pneumophila]HAT7759291.1 conjugal transfer protein TraM [Legionella pneumophila]HAU2065240.1 conjugal transfer protein TraM [Legionella pneumophila]